AIPEPAEELVHILSPFDPLIIQRKRLRLFFDYEYRFEAYVPKHKRIFGYFCCPVLIGDRIVAALDLKTDRARQKLLVQSWNRVGRSASRAHRQLIEAALNKFEQFQLGRS
ncbi:MAG: crosslink repair DNA glycosylase YcaQ family protein, partial [Candidatus Sulfotelmatobacter sp.]